MELLYLLGFLLDLVNMFIGIVVYLVIVVELYVLVL